MATLLDNCSHASISTLSEGIKPKDKEKDPESPSISGSILDSSRVREVISAPLKPLLDSSKEGRLENRVRSLSDSGNKPLKEEDLSTENTFVQEGDEQIPFHVGFIVFVQEVTTIKKQIDSIEESDFRILSKSRSEIRVWYFGDAYVFPTKEKGEYLIGGNSTRRLLIVDSPSGLIIPHLIRQDRISGDEKGDKQNRLSPQMRELLGRPRPKTSTFFAYEPLIFRIRTNGEIDVELNLFHIFTGKVDPWLGIKQRGKSLILFYGHPKKGKKAFELVTSNRGRYCVRGNHYTGELQITLPGGAIQILE